MDAGQSSQVTSPCEWTMGGDHSFPVAVNKRNLRRKGFVPTYRLHSTIKGSQGRRSRLELEAETMEENYFPACSTGSFSCCLRVSITVKRRHDNSNS